jgi:hypothetical protein
MAGEAKHAATAGPWRAIPNNSTGTRTVIVGPGLNAEYIAVTDNSNINIEKHEANARLITAAPELLEALKLIDADWTSEWPDGPDTEFREGCRFAESTLEFWRKARAAIAKATAT